MPHGNRHKNRKPKNIQRQESNSMCDRRPSNSESRSKFTVCIDEGELVRIKNWVQIKQDIETGGDLFGLWQDEKTAVVQFVLGPGHGCARTAVSFYQDLEYLKEAGNYLTQTHGLCNIGQWHSHHRLSLTRPSAGDENTVWGHMPSLGLKRYVMFIATIRGYDAKLTVDLNPYLFEIDQNGYRYPVAEGKMMILGKRNSPFYANEVVAGFVKNGQEVDPVAKRVPKDNTKGIGNTSKRPSYTADFYIPGKFQKIEMGFKWQLPSPRICLAVVTVKCSGKIQSVFINAVLKC